VNEAQGQHAPAYHEGLLRGGAAGICVGGFGARGGGDADEGLANISRHVTDTHFEPWFLDLNGILCRGMQYLPGSRLLL